MATQEEMTILLKMKDQASKVMASATGGLDKYKKQLLAVGAGVTAMGAGIETLARKQAPLLEATRKLANQTGLTEKEITGMATSLSNATFPLDEVIGLMDLASKQGLEGADALEKYANFWDTVGDATGLSSQELAKSSAALKAVGIETGKETELLGAFGLITKRTSGNVGDFLSSMERLAPEMREANLTVDDAAVLMTALENEMGFTAKTARAEFKEAIAGLESEMNKAGKAIEGAQDDLSELDGALASGAISQTEYNEATAAVNSIITTQQGVLKDLGEGGLSPMMELLGLTEEQVKKYQDSLQESTGVIQDMADAHASTRTPLEQLQSKFSDLTFTMAPFISQAAQIAPIMLAIGPATMALSAAKTIYTTVTGFATTATTVFGVALKVAMGPIGLIVLAILGLIAVGVLLYKNWDKVSAMAKKIWEGIMEFFQATWDTLVAIFTDNWKAILGILFPPFGIAMLVKENWGAVVGVVKDIFGAVKDAVTDAINKVIDKINSFINRVNSISITIPTVQIPLDGTLGGGSVGFPQIPTIPRLAAGGVFDKPTLALIAESGPEAVVPLGQLATVGGGGSRGTTVVVQGSVLTVQGDVQVDSLADRLEEAIDELERRTGVRLRAA